MAFKTNPLARELNERLEQAAPAVFAMLSPLGKRLYFPKGILSQSAEAKEKAHRFNATIGIATEKGEAMHLASVQSHLVGISPGSSPSQRAKVLPTASTRTARPAASIRSRSQPRARMSVSVNSTRVTDG